MDKSTALAPTTIITPAIEALIKNLTNKNPDVKTKAITAPGKIENPHAIEPLILAGLKENDSSNKYHIAESLKILSREDFSEDFHNWKNWWENHKNEY